MDLFPAIDLRGGRAVRLYQGDYDRMTVYNADPAAQARASPAAGAKFLHVVDLDGAKDGTAENFETIRAIAAGKVAAANIDEYLGFNHVITTDVQILPPPRLNNLPPHGRVTIGEREASERKKDFACIECEMSLEEAITHINAHHTMHSVAILSNDPQAIEAFMNGVDAAVVYANASTRFSDGEEFGFGAEIGISTQKLHARGPMGLRELTSYKFVIRGSGQTRA